jgi:D-sedoheptulose 7-phosphate isomerase
MMASHLLAAFQDAHRVLGGFIEDEANIAVVDAVSEALTAGFRSGKKALVCGNGGSACDAMHFAEEFTGRYRKSRRPLPVLALADPSHITCVANDYGFDEIFSRGVEAFGQEGDFFVGLSTSGNSPNVIKALSVAKERQLKSFMLLGKGGGKMAGLADFELIIEAQTSDRIQELHMLILHIVIEGVERRLFPDHY